MLLIFLVYPSTLNLRAIVGSLLGSLFHLEHIVCLTETLVKFTRFHGVTSERIIFSNVKIYFRNL